MNQTDETNLFQFHFDSSAPDQQTPIVPQNTQLVFQNYPQNYYFYSDNTPTNGNPDTNDQIMFSSPQLKPKNASPFQRKRFKTVSAQPTNLSPNHGLQIVKSNSETHEGSMGQDDDDDDDENSDFDSDHDSNKDSEGGNSKQNKRGKYKIYTEAEKATILNFMMKHGMQKTLEIFSTDTHKITKRKLKSWFDSQNKVKGVKGRKTNDPNRDQLLYEWCLQFQKECGRAPTRKEATKKALELSEDPTFQASKGWLDKFSRKYSVEFTSLKTSPPKNNKVRINGFLENDSISSNSETSSIEGISPLMQSMQSLQIQRNNSGSKTECKLEFPVVPNNYQLGFEPDEFKINSFFNFTTKIEGMEPQGYEKKDFIPSLEFNPQQPSNAGMKYYPNYSMDSYQGGYMGNYGGQAQGQYHQPSSNYQQNVQIYNFLNFGQPNNDNNGQPMLDYN